MDVGPCADDAVSIVAAAAKVGLRAERCVKLSDLWLQSNFETAVSA